VALGVTADHRFQESDDHAAHQRTDQRSAWAGRSSHDPGHRSEQILRGAARGQSPQLRGDAELHHLGGKIQERYGIAKDQARKDVDTWFQTLP
jgi:hypothetical protein